MPPKVRDSVRVLRNEIGKIDGQTGRIDREIAHLNDSIARLMKQKLEFSSRKVILTTDIDKIKAP